MNKKKLYILQEDIYEAIVNGELNDKMNVFKLKAAEIQLTDEDLNEIIQSCMKRFSRQKKFLPIISKYKTAICACILIIFALEWYFGIKSSWGLIWIIIANFVSALIVVLLVATVISRKIK